MNRRALALLFLRLLAGVLALSSWALAQTPQIGGISNAGNFQSKVAPGALISIFGTNLATGQASAKALPLPTNLLGTMVYINGIASPLLYVSKLQINAQVPYAIATNSVASVSVQVNGSSSPNSTLTVAEVAPAIFTLSGTGAGAGATLNFPSNSIVNNATPANPGELIEIFATGLGATTPPVATGAAGDQQPTVLPVTVTFGNITVPAEFAGAAGYAGENQVNVTVPSNAALGVQPIIISIGGVQSSANVTIDIALPVISPSYFGMHLANQFFEGTLPWPTIPFGTVRLNADNVTWADVEPSEGNFDFTKLDAALAGGEAHGITDFLNTLTQTPAWASSNSTSSGCSDYQGRFGGCYPPSDLNADGTGPDKFWQDYVTAFVQHVCTLGPFCKIQNWEIWNEPNAQNFWRGTIPQLVRLTQDAYKIIKSINPSLVVTSPPVAMGGDPDSDAASFLQSFLASGGRNYVDVIGFHGYVLPTQATADEAELLLSGFANLAGVRSTQGLTSKPMWDTEGSWGLTTNLPDPDLEASFVARYYLMQATLVQRFYWYAYDYPSGTLFNSTTLTLLEPGFAYAQVYNWMVGTAPTGPCTNSRTVYSCGFTRSGGYQALAVWDSSQTCSNGVCTTSAYTPPSGYTQYRDLTGNVTAITANAQIQLGVKPILLENENP
jgi:uncharacterized protein (TIGR03437 family)